MKNFSKYIVPFAAVATLALGADAATLSPIIQRNIPANCPVESKPMVRTYSPERSKTAGTSKLTVSVILDSSRGQEIDGILAVSADPEKPLLYQLEKQGNVYVADVETGVYDVVALIKSDNENTQIFLFAEDTEITSSKRVLLNQRNASIGTTIKRTAPSGIDIQLPEVGDNGNCSVADHLMILHHSLFGTLLQNETAAFRNVCTRVQTNLVPKRFSFVRMDTYTWENGPVFMVIPIDLNKEENGPAEGGWLAIDAAIAATPMSSAWKAMQEAPEFAMTGYFVAAGQNCNAYVNVGNYNHAFPTDRIYYWVPEDYDGYYSYYPVIRDNLIVMADASVSSMPFRLTPDGLVPSGLNLIGSGALMLQEGLLPESGHPRFSMPLPEDAKLANAVPALVCLPSSADSEGWDHGFIYDYTGRYGEQIGLDAYNFTDILTPDELSQIGGYHRTLKVTRDGSPICTSPGNFVKWLDWGNGEKYGMDVNMNNVLIDGEMEGANTASLTYSASNGFIPTVTSLHLRDNDVLTDRFQECRDATLELTAATFLYAGPNKFTYKAPTNVKAEYAPHGDAEFTALELNEIPEYFYMPGYGNYYKASLGNVNRVSNDKWYDLRITVEGEDGSAQTQTISPAFRLQNPGNGSGVDIVNTDNQTGCDVYSIDGRVIARGAENLNSVSLERGLYIIVENGITRKINID